MPIATEQQLRPSCTIQLVSGLAGEWRSTISKGTDVLFALEH